jgi:hypothetical protein
MHEVFLRRKGQTTLAELAQQLFPGDSYTPQQELALALAWDYGEAATMRRRKAKEDPTDPRHVRSAKALDSAARHALSLGAAERPPALVPFLEFVEALGRWGSWEVWKILECELPYQPSSARFGFDQPVHAGDFDRLIRGTFMDVLQDWWRYARRTVLEDNDPPPPSLFSYFDRQGYPLPTRSEMIAWDDHVRYMLRVFGRRDPECVWCGENVYMSLQGLHSGGIWTTESADEGPCQEVDGHGVRCVESPDGRHSCFAVDPEAWR